MGALSAPPIHIRGKFGLKEESGKSDIKIQVVSPEEMDPIIVKDVKNKAGLIFTQEMKVVNAKKDPFVRNWWKTLDGEDLNPHHTRDDGGAVLKRAPSTVSMNSFLAGGKRCMVCVDSKGKQLPG